MTVTFGILVGPLYKTSFVYKSLMTDDQVTFANCHGETNILAVFEKRVGFHCLSFKLGNIYEIGDMVYSRRRFGVIGLTHSYM